MRTLKYLPRLTLMKHLSSAEQKMLMAARRHRADYLRRMRQVKALAGAAGHFLIVAVCAAGFLAGTGRAQAAGAVPVSAPALFNEANAAQRAGDPGAAILGYERARLLAPRDAAIAQNLRAAREKAGVSAPAVPAWQRPAQALSLDGLAMLASMALLLFSLFAFGAIFIPATLRGFGRAARMMFGATALLAGSALALRWPELDLAVVRGAHATAHIAPATASGTAFELRPGELVTERREHGDFVLIRTPDERSGWVARADVERIIPPSGDPSPM